MSVSFHLWQRMLTSISELISELLSELIREVISELISALITEYDHIVPYQPDCQSLGNTATINQVTTMLATYQKCPISRL